MKFSTATLASIALSGTAFLGRGSAISPPDDATCIVQSDFTSGTLIIQTPGSYRLCENIVFNPSPPTAGSSPAEAFDPVYGEKYDENTYGLGFFAAIAIATDNVDIFLDGYKLEQSPAHALMQRFYANIELTSSPFNEGVGPAQFVGDGSILHASSNVRILGPGTLGRASHHGIHGNNNANIKIQDITFKDFEVAAVSLNNVDGLQITENLVQGNRKDVPVNGMFSAARFIRPYGAVLKDRGFQMTLQGQTRTAAELYDNLIASIENVYNDVLATGAIDSSTHPDEFYLFDNHFKVIDGPCYAFLVHGIGPAVGGQGFFFDEDSSKTSSNVAISNNVIQDIQCWNYEVPAAVVNGKVQNDARGAVFQWFKSSDLSPLAMNDDGTYRGNVVADMQIMVAKAIHDGFLTNTDLLQTGTNTIERDVVEWAETAGAVLDPHFRCGGDSMHHVAKGVIVIRVEDTRGFDIQGNTIEGVENLSFPPFPICFDVHAGTSVENPLEQQGGNIRVISVAATRPYNSGHDSTIKKNLIRQVDSTGDSVLVVGIDIQGESSGIKIQLNNVDLKAGVGTSILDKYVGLRIRENADGSSIKVQPNNNFAQEIQRLAPARRLRNIKPSFESHQAKPEWELGGCPFANKSWRSPR